MSCQVATFGSQLALLLASLSPSTPPESGPSLRVQGDAAAGHVTLQWQPAKDSEEDTDTEFLLEQASNAEFSDARTRYQGPHHSSVLSGLPNGSYYFRVRSRPATHEQWGEWSTTQLFTVEHHSLVLALVLFGIGAAVFGLTMAFLLVSTRRPFS